MCRNVLHAHCLGKQLVVSGLQRAPGCYSSVTHTCWTTVWVPGKERIFLSAAKTRPALGLNHLPTEWQPGVLSSWVTQLDNAIDCSVSSGAIIDLYPYIPSWHSAKTNRQLYISYYILLHINYKFTGTCKVKCFMLWCQSIKLATLTSDGITYNPCLCHNPAIIKFRMQ